jgi:hypothetical protein
MRITPALHVQGSDKVSGLFSYSPLLGHAKSVVFLNIRRDRPVEKGSFRIQENSSFASCFFNKEDNFLKKLFGGVRYNLVVHAYSLIGSVDAGTDLKVYFFIFLYPDPPFNLYTFMP